MRFNHFLEYSNVHSLYSVAKNCVFLLALVFSAHSAFAGPPTCPGAFLNDGYKGFSSRTIKKYNTPTCLNYVFTRASLIELNEFYHSQVVPDLILNFINHKHSQFEVMLREAPELVEWNPSRDTFVTNNHGYNSTAEILDHKINGSLAGIKHQTDGLSLITWYVHPKISKAVEARAKGRKAKIADLEIEGEPYKVSMLDLTPFDLPRLRELKHLSERHLKENYGITEQDDVRLFFHFPYAVDTMTLHLHIRVNQPAHPLEAAKSYALEEVISHLETGRPIADLILNRQKDRGGLFANAGAENVMSLIRNGHVKVVPNPFYDPNLD